MLRESNFERSCGFMANWTDRNDLDQCSNSNKRLELKLRSGADKHVLFMHK